MEIKKIIIGVFIFIYLLIVPTIASAYSHYDSSYFPTYRKVYNDKNPGEYSGFVELLKRSFATNSRSDFSRRNFDSSSLDYDYRGPMFERQIIFKDEFNKKRDDTSFLFFSDEEERIHKSSTVSLIEKYIGASESLFIDNQNRRTELFESNQKESEDYKEKGNYREGFSWRKARLFDPNEYDNSYDNYYYRPHYDPKLGYYNWRW